MNPNKPAALVRNLFWFVPLFLGLGFLINAPYLNDGFWTDEASHAGLALFGSWKDAWSEMGLSNQRLFTPILKLLFHFGGFSEALARVPNVIMYALFACFLAVTAGDARRSLFYNFCIGFVLGAVFLMTPAAIYLSHQARGHMMSAAAVALGFFYFDRAASGRDTEKNLVISAMLGSVALANVATGVVYFAAVWAVTAGGLVLKKPVLNVKTARFFYGLCSAAIIAVGIVYAPSAAGIVLWLGGNPQWQSFHLQGSIFPWTNGPLGLAAFVFIGAIYLRYPRQRRIFLMAAFCIAAIIFLCASQRNAKHLYLAPAGLVLYWAAAVFCREFGENKKTVWGVLACLTAASALGFPAYLKDLKSPQSDGREKVSAIQPGQSVLLAGHCEAPKFYLRLKGVEKITSTSDFKKLQALISGTGSFDWVILDGRVAGSEPAGIVEYLSTRCVPKAVPSWNSDIRVWKCSER